ncbi:H-NS family nucleoid-associated regulatory protein [Palleronia caenipelagi]|uniref:H-NS histone family protein n=1 Tax=Palleronia caenipelagi TaxID=2489174 RepID=A0A547PT20_9RHOB|nr:H-NS histone family protein [Palleronia caenipelagi]TRD17296.1 H-NS histone family protein [Palleronia caenipelagi]
MTKDFDLDGMDLQELKALQKAVTRAIDGFEDRKRAEALKAAQLAAKDHGFDLNQLMAETNGPKTRPALPPKYRHPENPSLTWSGRGRKPRWIAEALESGQSLDDFLIAA